MSHSCVENYMHIIFCTKNRLPLIHSKIEENLYAYIVGISKKNKVRILQINGMEDHIHILLNLHPSVALATLIKEYKAYSTSWMKKNGYPNFSWQRGYGGFSYSKSLIEPVVKYIANQKEHHRTYSLKDEITMLIKNWGVEWNWDDDEDDYSEDNESPSGL